MRGPLDGNAPEVEQLLAAERAIVPEPDDVRDSAVARAQAALPRNPDRYVATRTTTLHRARLGLAVAAAVLLFAVCAAAFFAGHRIKTDESPPPAAPQARPPRALEPAVAAPPTISPAVTTEPPTREPQSARVRPAAAKKSASDSDADLMELRVLRPAQQAEWRGDFASALAAIADHQRRFPSGQLAEEREGLRIRALLGLGRVGEARSAGAAFRRRFPHSALLERIDAMLERQP